MIDQALMSQKTKTLDEFSNFIERQSASRLQIENFKVGNLTKSRLQPGYQNLLKKILIYMNFFMK